MQKTVKALFGRFLRRQGSHTPPALSHSPSRVFKKLKKYLVAQVGSSLIKTDAHRKQTRSKPRTKFQRTVPNTPDLPVDQERHGWKCGITAFGRGCVGLEWFDSVVRTQLRGYRAHCGAAEGSSSQTKRREGRGARPAMRAAPPAASGGNCRRPGSSAPAPNNRERFPPLPRLGTGRQFPSSPTGKPGQKVLGKVPTN